jgi:hypothetical protein
MDNQFLSIESKKDTMITRKRQVERGVLSKAIYMVTNLFAENEPLKTAIRAEVVKLLADTKNTYQTSVLKDMLQLSGDMGLVSDINTKILLEAVDAVKDVKITEEVQIEIADMFNATLSDSDDIRVDTQTDTPIELGKNDNQDKVATPISQLPNLAYTYVNKVDKVEHPNSHISKGFQEKEHSKMPSEKQVSHSSSVAALDIGARRKKILEVVRSKGQATIHEFISSIQGCSSKTIQRELTSLVLSGTLKKTGERRWSKYSLR